MSIRLRVWITQSGFVAALIALAVLLLWAFYSYEDLASRNRLALSIVGEAQATLVALQNAEDAERDFMVDGNTSTLASFEVARDELSTSISRLQTFANSLDGFANGAHDLTAIASGRLSRLENAVALRRSRPHPDDASVQATLRANEADEEQTHASMASVISFEQHRAAALQLRLEAAKKIILRAIVYGIGALAVLALVLLLVNYRFVSRPLQALAAGLDQISRNENPSAIAVPGGDELGLVAEAFNRLAEDLHTAEARRRETEDELSRSNDELIARNAEVVARTRSIDLLGRMAYRLPGCRDIGEFAAVVERFVPQLFPHIPGVLYVLSGSHTLLREVARWNDPKGCVDEFTIEDCWGLRRGQAHEIENVSSDVVCAHVERDAVIGYRCIPLVAQSETVGLLYLERTDSTVPWAIEEHDLRVLAETLALALVNLKLRESLRDQSVRDPLTGLFNRRYLEEALEIEEARASRAATHLAAIMVDIDYFKRFNDEFGHDAGDVVLKSLAELMTSQVRAGDIACRFGGEEFLIVLPGATPERAVSCAENLRRSAEALAITHHGKSIGKMTISLGVAMMPEAASTTHELIEAADAALYAAKRAGRNRVEIAPSANKSLVAVAS